MASFLDLEGLEYFWSKIKLRYDDRLDDISNSLTNNNERLTTLENTPKSSYFEFPFSNNSLTQPMLQFGPVK